MDFIIYPFGWFMKLLYNLVKNYGLALLLFTLITRLVMLPLSIKQQKSMAKMSVFNPLIQEIQKKYANNKEKMQEEMTKLYTEYNISPATGCGPMMIQMAFVMILYEVIRKPLRFFVGLSSTMYPEVINLAKGMSGFPVAYQDSFIIDKIQSGSTEFLSILGPELQEKIMDLDFTLFGMDALNLNAIPKDGGFSLLWIIPILSAISMIASQYITSKVTGQQMKGGMAIMMYGMSIWIGYLGFTLPAALSLYWFYANVLGLVQSLVLRKYYSPEKFKAQMQAELDAKRAAKKKKKKISYTDDTTGQTVEKEVNEAELAKIRLARAREQQEEKFRGFAQDNQSSSGDSASDGNE